MPRSTKEEAQRTRQALLDAAEQVFDSCGVAGASLQAVAQAAGLTRGAVYWHFQDKADLFNAMMDRAVLPFEALWLQAGPARQRAPLQRLRGVLVEALRRIAQDPALQRVLGISTQKVEYVGELGAVRERHLRVRTQSLARIEALLREAAAQGELAPRTRPRAAAFALYTLVDGLVTNWMLDRSAFDLVGSGRTAIGHLLDGLRAGADRRR